MTPSPSARERQHHARVRDALRPDIPIVCFANDWRGPPTSKHHVMRLYSAYTDVLWIEASGMRRPNLMRLHDLRRSADRLWRAMRRPADNPRQNGRVSVSSPLLVPLPGSASARWINGRVIRRTVSGAARRRRWRQPPLLWVYTPTVSPCLGSIPSSGVVYHCVDRWWEFSEYDPAIMRAHHARLCRIADVVFASSQALFEDCRALTERAFKIPHGVDWEHFARAALLPPRPPEDISDLKGPVVGFFGLVHDWVDLGLVRRVAQRFPDSTLVLIGPVRIALNGLERLPNVRVLGPRPYEHLPAYCAGFDVALIPFVLNELTAAVNPVKLREYLSAGVPTVATALPELRPLATHPGLHVAGSEDEFVEAVGHALARGRDEVGRRDLALAMAEHSWSARCADMAEQVRRTLR